MQWSQYSQDLFDMYRSSKQNIIVQACPGAGKTTNIKHLWGLDSKSTVYLVFNKANQVEAEGKLPHKQNSHVLTLNSLGARALYNSLGRVTLDVDKVKNIVRRYIKFTGPSKQRNEQQWMLIKAVNMAKGYMLSDHLDVDSFYSMVDTYDLETYPGMIHDVERCLEISDTTVSVVDFNDQVRLPALYGYPMPVYDVVLGDEVQDFSPIQALLVSKINAQRYVFVGDKRQAIYGFRGAMNDSMAYLQKRFGCVEMPLSITYRCAHAVVTEAKKVWPEIQAWDQAKQGSVEYAEVVNGDGNKPMLTWQGDVLVVCRMTRPLIQTAMELLSDNISCHVRGRDIGVGLIKLIQQQEAQAVRELIDRLTEWYEVEVAKANAKEDEDKAQKVKDKYDSVMLFVGKVRLNDSPDVVVDLIADLFEQGNGVCLSTVHKAKGLEATEVYFVEPGLYSAFKKRAKQQWQADQESNIQYVGVTRAKERLVYV